MSAALWNADRLGVEVTFRRRGAPAPHNLSYTRHARYEMSDGTRLRIERYIELQPGVRSGKPCFKGTRITVYDVLEYLAGGMTEAELVADFPPLTPQHIRATLVLAAARAQDLLGLDKVRYNAWS